MRRRFALRIAGDDGESSIEPLSIGGRGVPSRPRRDVIGS